jgi:ferritin-like metal-binding protein YciE
LISAAQRVEHYEIAAYGTLRNFASVLGEHNAVSLLEKTLNDEKETDEKLTELSDGIHAEAASYESEERGTERSTSNTKAKAAGSR